MTLAWIVYGLLVGTLVAATAAALARALHLAGRPTRLLWGAALALTAALVLGAPGRFTARGPGISGMVREVSAPGLSMPRHRAGFFESAALLFRARLDEASSLLPRALGTLGRSAPAWSARTAGALWIASGVALLLVFGVVYARFVRARRHWPRLRLHDTPVRVAPGAGPAVIGVARPEIVVPRWLLDRTAEEQRLVLAHEREHVAARDPLLLAAGCVAVALLPWNPAAWWMLSRLRLAVELDCDARVLRRGVSPRSYGTLLIDLAGQCSGLRVGAPALADESSHLEQRLLAMKKDSPRFARLRALGFAGAAALALVAACEAKLPTESEVANMDAKSATAGAEKIRLIDAKDTAGLVYVVDGVQVSAAQANAITPERIATINVEKTVDEGGRGVGRVAITTRKPGDTTAVHEVRFRTKQEGELPPLEPGANLRKFSGIVLIDGKRSTEAEMNALAPSDIVSVEVMKGPAAAKQYDAPEAANGVIKITTKKGAAKP